MELNKQTDYALRVLIYLSICPTERLANINDIAIDFNIARNHLIKIITKLNKLGFIQTVRGVRGGVRLATTSLNLSIAEIITQFEDVNSVINCKNRECPVNGICKLQGILKEASQSFVKTLASYTLKDLIDDNNTKKVKLVLRSKHLE